MKMIKNELRIRIKNVDGIEKYELISVAQFSDGTVKRVSIAIYDDLSEAIKVMKRGA